MQGVDADMDLNLFRGIILIIMVVSFLGLWIWAWSRKRKPAFYEASMLPLEEDKGVIPDDDVSADDISTDGQGVNHAK
jgi:cytochrome c oxidase cbb3-type subunit 4